jgi:hypothetical protein
MIRTGVENDCQFWWTKKGNQGRLKTNYFVEKLCDYGRDREQKNDWR